MSGSASAPAACPVCQMWLAFTKNAEAHVDKCFRRHGRQIRGGGAQPVPRPARRPRSPPAPDASGVSRAAQRRRLDEGEEEEEGEAVDDGAGPLEDDGYMSLGDDDMYEDEAGADSEVEEDGGGGGGDDDDDDDNEDEEDEEPVEEVDMPGVNDLVMSESDDEDEGDAEAGSEGEAAADDGDGPGRPRPKLRRRGDDKMKHCDAEMTRHTFAVLMMRFAYKHNVSLGLLGKIIALIKVILALFLGEDEFSFDMPNVKQCKDLIDDNPQYTVPYTEYMLCGCNATAVKRSDLPRGRGAWKECEFECGKDDQILIVADVQEQLRRIVIRNQTGLVGAAELFDRALEAEEKNRGTRKELVERAGGDLNEARKHHNWPQALLLDVCDGRVYMRKMEEAGLSKDEPNKLFLSFAMDGACPGGQYTLASVTPVKAFVCNLPPPVRNDPDNVIFCSIFGGPGLPTDQRAGLALTCDQLECMVGRDAQGDLKTVDFADTARGVHVVPGMAQMDNPAAQKAFCLLGHRANVPCHTCDHKMETKARGRGKKTRYMSGAARHLLDDTDDTKPKLRTKEVIFETERYVESVVGYSSTVREAREIVKDRGLVMAKQHVKVAVSPLVRQLQMDPFEAIVVDVLHVVCGFFRTLFKLVSGRRDKERAEAKGRRRQRAKQRRKLAAARNQGQGAGGGGGGGSSSGSDSGSSSDSESSSCSDEEKEDEDEPAGSHARQDEARGTASFMPPLSVLERIEDDLVRLSTVPTTFGARRARVFTSKASLRAHDALAWIRSWSAAFFAHPLLEPYLDEEREEHLPGLHAMMRLAVALRPLLLPVLDEDEIDEHGRNVIEAIAELEKYLPYNELSLLLHRMVHLGKSARDFGSLLRAAAFVGEREVQRVAKRALQSTHLAKSSFLSWHRSSAATHELFYKLITSLMARMGAAEAAVRRGLSNQVPFGNNAGLASDRSGFLFGRYRAGDEPIRIDGTDHMAKAYTGAMINGIRVARSEWTPSSRRKSGASSVVIVRHNEVDWVAFVRKFVVVDKTHHAIVERFSCAKVTAGGVDLPQAYRVKHTNQGRDTLVDLSCLAFTALTTRTTGNDNHTDFIIADQFDNHVALS